MLYDYLIENKELLPKREPDMIITIYTLVDLRKPIRFINESKKSSGVNKEVLDGMDAARAIIHMDTKSGKKIDIYVRNRMGGGRNGMPSQHGPSIKIERPTINGVKGIPILVPRENENATVDCNNKTTKMVQRDWNEVIEFTEDNRKELKELWDTKKQKDFVEGIKNIIKNNTNEDYTLSYAQTP